MVEWRTEVLSGEFGGAGGTYFPGLPDQEVSSSTLASET
jgi:hypothetical protein